MKNTLKNVLLEVSTTVFDGQKYKMSNDVFI